ncbi:hypothetical protein [Brevundimonas sp.]|uniref:hypothetical protein n=1 Tax=Brevundimonas sp. TaxID=1871086 RepID=UPI002D41F166|nr:hypothetical protein [Brevundimonas sp.]HYD26936.1 hypothetical protein [Brevundimonas sp.]
MPALRLMLAADRPEAPASEPSRPLEPELVDLIRAMARADAAREAHCSEAVVPLATASV